MGLRLVRVYLASPDNQLQADVVRGLPVLISFAGKRSLDPYLPSYGRVLLDSGAYSEMNSGKKIDLEAYAEWAKSLAWADAWAGLDDISGDWKRSLRNYEAGGFPTFHDSDPPELLDDLLDIARERGGWIGVGLTPPRYGREDWVRRTLDRIPDEMHVHGWACGLYAHLPGFASIDSTHWWREAMKLRSALPWLTYGETLEIAIKKQQRIARAPRIEIDGQIDLLAEENH